MKNSGSKANGHRKGSEHIGLLIALGLLSLVILILVLNVTKHNAPDPSVSPLEAQAADLPEVPGAIGYISISLPNYRSLVTGTIAITHELRVDGSRPIAFRVDRHQVVIKRPESVAETIGPSLYFDEAWPVVLTRPGSEWVKGRFWMTAPVTVTYPISVYADLQTAIVPDARGFYRFREIDVYTQFLPVVVQ